MIVMSSNPSTGYSWQESHDQSFVALVDKTFEQPPESKVCRRRGTEYFRFKALKADETKITLGIVVVGKQAAARD